MRDGRSCVVVLLLHCLSTSLAPSPAGAALLILFNARAQLLLLIVVLLRARVVRTEHDSAVRFIEEHLNGVLASPFDPIKELAFATPDFGELLLENSSAVTRKEGRREGDDRRNRRIGGGQMDRDKQSPQFASLQINR